MLITIIYPKEDYIAANVSIKVQVLAQNKDQKVYVVPKHFGRNKTEIQKNLNKTSIALFISQSVVNVDPSTIEELRFLKSKKKKIIGFLPDDVAIPKVLEDYIDINRFHTGDAESLKETIFNYLEQVKNNRKPKTKKVISGNQDSVVIIGLILFLFLLAFSSDE